MQTGKRVFWAGVFLLGLGAISSSVKTGGAASAYAAGSNAVVVRTQIVPFKTATGLASQMVLIDWKNIGKKPIRLVHATIDPYDKAGHRLGSGADDYTIYAVFPDQAGIKGGQVYHEPKGEGFILLPAYGKAAQVRVKITQTSTEGMRIQ